MCEGSDVNVAGFSTLNLFCKLIYYILRCNCTTLKVLMLLQYLYMYTENLEKFLKKIFTRPKGSQLTSQKAIIALWILRIITFMSGIYQTFFGETIIGIAIMVCTIFLIAPSFFSGKRITYIPVEVELVLFIAVFVQYVLGEARDFYTTIPYYDKFVHLLLPGLIGYMGFIIIYTLYFSGKLKVSIHTMIVFTVLITVGIGALWEIFEYGNDTLILPIFPNWHKFQGSLVEGPLVDTMNDLIADTIGGIIGAVVTSGYIIKKEGVSERMQEFFEEISGQMFKDSHFLNDDEKK